MRGSRENVTGSFPWGASPLHTSPWSRIIINRLDFPQIMETVGGIHSVYEPELQIMPALGELWLNS